MHLPTFRRRALAAVVTVLAIPALAACSFEIGELEPVGGEEQAERTEPDTSEESADPTDAPDQEATQEVSGERQVVEAAHIRANIPADWQGIGDADGWSYVHQLTNDEGGVAARIGFMPGGTEMTATEAVDWFVEQVEGQGVTDENYAPVTTLRDDPDRANTSYTYTSGGETYVAVVWGLVDADGAPSLVQLSGAHRLVTQELVADIDRGLNLAGTFAMASGD